VRLRLVRTDGREVARVTTRPAILSYMGDGCLSEMPVKIERIDPWHVDVPLPAPVRPSWIPGFVQPATAPR
jgi:hypothetical protein